MGVHNFVYNRNVFTSNAHVMFIKIDYIHSEN